MAGRGILLNADNDLTIMGGTLAVGDTLMQEVGIIIQLQQGTAKMVPLLGPDLLQLKKTNLTRFEMEQRLRVHLAIDGKNYKELKSRIEAVIKA